MDFPEPDFSPIQASALGLTQERWVALIKMLADDGYIEGITIKRYIRTLPVITDFEPVITLKGLEYLHDNSFMKKMAETAKGIQILNLQHYKLPHAQQTQPYRLRSFAYL